MYEPSEPLGDSPPTHRWRREHGSDEPAARHACGAASYSATRVLKFRSVKNPHAVALGRRGALAGAARGGRARAHALTSERRRTIAREAAAARWGRLPESLRDLFWNYKFEDLRLPDDLDLVMLHVLTYGSQAHRRWLVRRFGDDGIRAWIVRNRGRGLTVQQMSPWVAVRTARRWQAANPYALLWENR
jgi:hypothetical protein